MSGQYDDLCFEIQERTGALAVFLAIGTPGGIAVTMQAPPSFASELPSVLREMADKIEADTMPDRVRGAH